MKRLLNSDSGIDKEDQWSPDVMIELLESFKDRPIGRV